jgi:cation transport ATPase
VAEELLGSVSQRKGAASVSADAVLSHSSQDGACGADVGCCQNHTHDQPTSVQNPVHRVLLWIYSHTGLFQLANLLRENTLGSIAISVLFAAAALTHWQAGGAWLSATLGERISNAATALVYLIAGVPAFVDLTFDLASLHIDTHVLMTLAVLGTLAIGGALEGALLLVLFQVSHTVEHKLTDQAQGNLRTLFDSIPESATVVELDGDGEPVMDSQRQVAAADVRIGSTMLVKPGEQVPLDGDIVYGEAQVSMQHITGEAMPTRQAVGASVPAGSQNHDGVLVVRATSASDDSTPARISKMAADAQASKPQLRRWIDDVGEVYAKFVIAATIAALIILPLRGVPMLSQAGQRGAFYRAMGLLTTASPCALVLVPLSYVSAIAAITSRGMLIKGGKVLDALASCETIAFDKTGTLTTGALACTGLTAPSSGSAAAGDGASQAAASTDLSGSGWLQQCLQRGREDDCGAGGCR